MPTQRELFLHHLAQTSPAPLSLEIEKAKGVYLYGPKGNKYLDLISGISVSNLGHGHPKVLGAISKQLKKHLHLMVYGEFVQGPQVAFATLLGKQLPPSLRSVYFVNSGAEAIEGAMKLAKRSTGRTEIISFHNDYHGSTQGALSIMGNEELKKDFRPLLPDTRLLRFGNKEDLKLITTKTACVVAETIQGEAGVIVPSKDYLQQLRKRCTETGTLLVLDEIQCAFGRTGKLFGFEHYGIRPDILCLAKALGGGMPLGAFISSQQIMSSLSNNPALGHITTFGGHPLCCVAGQAALEVLLKGSLVKQVQKKEKLFRSLLKHKAIKEVRSKGLLIAVQFENEALNKKVIANCIENGVVTDWFLFNDSAMRIAPPLTITEAEIRKACAIILKCLMIICETTRQ